MMVKHAHTKLVRGVQITMYTIQQHAVLQYKPPVHVKQNKCCEIQGGTEKVEHVY